MSDDHCHGLFDKMSAFLDGELDQQMMDQIERHIKDCNCCRECMETVRQTRDLLQASPKSSIPDDLKARLKECLKDHS